jgi:hypothetical protein
MTIRNTHDLATMVIDGQPMLAAIPHFSILDTVSLDESVMARFQAKVQIPEDPDACQLWDGSVYKDGYGALWTQQGMIRAHRLLYRSVAGRIPEFVFMEHGRREDVIVGHTCHDRDLSCRGGRKDPHRLCVNERHLALQTRTRNVLQGRRWFVNSPEHLEMAA